jgi:hypothetical protein
MVFVDIDDTASKRSSRVRLAATQRRPTQIIVGAKAGADKLADALPRPESAPVPRCWCVLIRHTTTHQARRQSRPRRRGGCVDHGAHGQKDQGSDRGRSATTHGQASNTPKRSTTKTPGPGSARLKSLRSRSPRSPRRRSPCTRRGVWWSAASRNSTRPNARVGRIPCSTCTGTTRFFTTIDRDRFDTVAADQVHRRHAIIEQINAELKNGALAHMPSGGVQRQCRLGRDRSDHAQPATGCCRARGVTK